MATSQTKTIQSSLADKKIKSISYAKWGYIFLAPFFIAYVIFALEPLISTIYNSFFQNYMVGLTHVGPKFVGFDNYANILTQGDLLTYFLNTMIIWILGFVPQILISLLLASWFTDLRLKLRGLGFFKTVIYMPNLIMASAFSMLFYAIFTDGGPVNNILANLGMDQIRFFAQTDATRGIIAFMNFLMWFGNTTILLMAGIMGIDNSLFESAQIDGAKSWQIFWKVTMPNIKPILVFVLITSLIGGLQLFDIPQVLTKGTGQPALTTMTLIMYLNKHLYSKNFGLGGALSVLLFIITAVLSVIVFRMLSDRSKKRRELK
jgi:ABC-type sugar transport systems, permease components